jgi:hypothetical protein
MTVGGTPIQTQCSTPLFVKGLSINGVPLHQMGRIERIWGNVLGAPAFAGQPFHVPLMPGMIDVRPVPTYSDFTVGITLYGSTSNDGPGIHSAWRELARLVWDPAKPLLIQRDVEFLTGIESHQCNARYVSGLDIQPVTENVQGIARTTLRFRNIDAYWYDVEETVIMVSPTATETIGGDTETSRMTITFGGGSAGTPQILTNETTGASVTFGGDTSTHEVVLNVTDFTAVQNNQSVLAYVAHSGAVPWMLMAPGENVLTLTGGGQAQIRLRNAYL